VARCTRKARSRHALGPGPLDKNTPQPWTAALKVAHPLMLRAVVAAKKKNDRIEAAKMAPRHSPALALLYDQEKRKGNANRATLAVARKLMAYLMAVDRGQRNFRVPETSDSIAA
jgi:hypothetical protein